MSARPFKFIISIYPKGWRRRYGRELEQLVRDLEAGKDRAPLRIAADLLFNAASARVRNSFVTGLCIVFLGGIATGAVAAYHLSNTQTAAPGASQQRAGAHQTHIVLSHNRQTGQIEAVSSAQIIVRLNPKTSHIESITRRRR